MISIYVFSESEIPFWMFRRKYELQQFLHCDLQLSCPFPPSSSSHCSSSGCCSVLPTEKKHYEKQTTGHRIQGLGLVFRNSWRRSEHKTTKKSNSMVKFLPQKMTLNMKRRHIYHTFNDEKRKDILWENHFTHFCAIKWSHFVLLQQSGIKSVSFIFMLNFGSVWMHNSYHF